LTPAETDLVVTNNGDITQPIERNGLIKGMAAISGAGQIVRCFNGITGSSTGTCGFTIAHTSAGVFYVNFHFDTANRFISVTSEGDGSAGPVVANARPFGTTEVLITLHQGSTHFDTSFHVIVF
jgi:hypothetical protein